MAQQNYQINQAIKVYYQAAGVGTGLTVQMDVYDEADVKDVGQSAAMTEIGATGRYQASFTPDANGSWHVEISDSAGGEAIKTFDVGTYNISTVGADVATLDGKVDTIEGKIDAIDVELDAFTAPPMVG